MWEESEITIGEVQHLLDDYDIEVDSPDGYVPVNFFVDKGIFQEYLLKNTSGDTIVRCNKDHLFESNNGWVSACDLAGKGFVDILNDEGNYEKYEVVSTDNNIPIVDINVDHENHRYYTNGISSHNTGVGKSLFMCHVAGNAMIQGHDVLYITMEMAEERIAERVDANLMDLPMDQVETLSEEMFRDKISRITKKSSGKLIVKEYPTGQAHAGHFRALLNELKLKKKFVPKLIFIDYLNICASSRMKGMGGAINSYSYIKSIAEEIRGLAVEFNVPIVSATQTTRAGYGSSDPGLEDTSESFGLPATADLMVAMISNEELAANNQVMIKQLKNRYNNPDENKRFVIGVDKSKMKLSDVEQEVAMEVADDGDDVPLFDKTTAGKRVSLEGIKV